MISIWVVPGNVLNYCVSVLPANLTVLEEFTTVKIGMREPKLDKLTGEVAETFARIVQIPVEPSQLVILAIAVVVAALGSGDLIASCEHWDALG